MCLSLIINLYIKSYRNLLLAIKKIAYQKNQYFKIKTKPWLLMIGYKKLLLNNDIINNIC